MSFAGSALISFQNPYTGFSNISVAQSGFVGQNPQDSTGSSIIYGDFDGDGHDDVLIYSNNGGFNNGNLYLFYGPIHDVQGINTTNYDAFWYGTGTGVYFGSALAVGDFNNDSYDDILAGAFNYDSWSGPNSYVGCVFLIYGQPQRFRGATNMQNPGLIPPVGSNPYNWSWCGEHSGDTLGYSVAAGDINGDGYDDMLMGAPSTDHYGTGLNDEGAVYIVYGNSSVYNDPNLANRWSLNVTSFVNATLYGEWFQDRCGYGISSGGDFNDDGYEDALFGCAYADEPSGAGNDVGRAYLLYGRQGPYLGQSDNVTNNASYWYGEANNDLLGSFSTSISGNIDGDQYDDIVIPNDYASFSPGVTEGKVYLKYGQGGVQYPMGQARNISSVDAEWYGEADGDNFGRWTRANGDINEDGYDDLVVGAYERMSPFGDSQAGQVYLFYGQSSRFSSSISAANYNSTWYGEDQQDWLGYDIAISGDINDDGSDDIIVGATGWGAPGKAYVLFGNNNISLISDVFVNATSAMNGTDDNLTCWVNATDDDPLDNLTYSGFWYKDGIQNYIWHWNASYPRTSHYGYGIGTDWYNNVYVTGSQLSYPFLVKYLPNGTLDWNITIPTVVASYRLAVDKSSDIVVSLDQYIGGKKSGMVHKYDDDGYMKWNSSYTTNVANDEIYGYGIAVDSQNNVILAARKYNSFGNANDGILSKFDQSGKSLWNVTWASGIDTSNYFVDVGTDSQDNVIALGHNGTYYYWVINKYMPNGSLMWSEPFIAGGSAFSNFPHALAIDSQDNIIVTGDNCTSIGYEGVCDIFVANYSSSGTQNWRFTWGTSSGPDLAYDVAIDSMGQTIVTGNASSYGFGGDMLVLILNGTGDMVMNWSIGDPGSTEMGYGIAVDNHDNLLVTGRDDDYGSVPAVLYKYGGFSNTITGTGLGIAGTLNSSMTQVGENWTCKAKAFDRSEYTAYSTSKNGVLISDVIYWINITWPEGIYEPQNASVTWGTHKSEFNITFQEFSGSSGQNIECQIRRSDNSTLVLNETLSSSYSNVTYNLSYTLTANDWDSSYIDRDQPWYVYNCSLRASEGGSAIYTNSSDYGSPLRKNIFVHGNFWTKFDTQTDDGYKAQSCYQGFDKVYFNNTRRCDWAGDVTFSVKMSQGAQVEGWCHNGQDDDTDAATDCSDDDCSGITYSCLSHPSLPDPAFNYSGTAVCSNGVCSETATVGGYPVTYYFNQYVRNSSTESLKVRFDAGNHNDAQGRIMEFAITSLQSGNWTGCDKYAGPGSHNLTQTSTSGITCKAWEQSSYSGDIDMVLYTNLSSYGEGQTTFELTITQYGDSLLIENIPLYINDSSPTAWNESDPMAGVIDDPCADSWDNDMDYYSNCADQDCDLQVGGSDCTGGDAYCEYGLELTCYDCFNNDAEDGYDCAEAECDLKPGDYQDMTNLCEYQEGAGFSNATHESFYPWKTACQDTFDNDQDAASPYGPLLNIDCCDTTVCWQKGGTSTDTSNFPCPAQENNTANNTVGSWCHDGIDNDYDDGSNNADCNVNTGADCRDYDCRGVSNTTHTCPVHEAYNLTGQFNASQCFDGIDNDLDNPSMTYNAPAANIDCADLDCLGVANPANPNQVCYPYEFNLAQHYQFCADSFDNDGDAHAGWPGGTDCGDSDCYQQFNGCGPCPEEENVTWDSCANGLDDDYDNTADSFTDGQDCADINCSGEIGSTANGERCEYGTETSCFDGFDNDAQGGADCADSDCNGVGWCEHGTETTCSDDLDNDADGYIDCVDTDCYGVGTCSPKLWSTVGCLTVPAWTGNSRVGSSTIYTNHLYRLHVYDNFTINITGTGTYWAIAMIIGKTSPPADPFPFNATNCTLIDPTDSLQWVTSGDDLGTIQDINVSQSTPLNGFSISLTCGGNESAQSESYPVTISNQLSSGTESGSKTHSYTIYENVAPSVHRIEAGPVNATDGINIPYGGTVRYRANASNDPSGICQCQFDLDSSSFPNTDGDCTYSTTYTQDDGVYTVRARSRDRANNLGSYGGSRTFQINVMPVSTSTNINKTEPFFYSTEDMGFGASFQTSSDGSFPGTCNYYIQDAMGSVYSSGTLTKTSLGSGAAECNGTIPVPNIDMLYTVYVNITDEDGDQVSSESRVFYVCDSLASNGTGWTCAKADFDQDGWTEGVTISMYGQGFVCDMCPGQVNTGRDDDADGIDNVCDLSCGFINNDTTMIQDLNVTGDCFIINASNITFDCADYILRGDGSGIAINVTGQENVSIFNCTILNFTDAIMLHDSNSSHVWENTLYNNSNSGVIVELSNNGTLEQNNVSSNAQGVYLDTSENITVYNNTADYNYIGIYDYNSIFNSIRLNTVRDSSQSGIYLDSAENITVSGNALERNPVGILLDSADNNSVCLNTVRDSSQIGIHLDSAENNTISNNTFLENQIGANLTDNSVGNVLYSNNFTGSIGYHAGSVSGNMFYRTNTSKPQGYQHEGNTWDDLSTLQIFDTDGDGFGDYGSQYPYNATNGANVTGFVNDLGPYPANLTTVVAWLNISFPEGVYEPYNATIPGTHKFDFNITFQNFSASSGSILECEIEMSNGSMLYLNKTLGSSVSNGQEYLNHNMSFSDSYNKTSPWWVHNCSLYNSGRGLLYTNATDYGREPWLGKKIFVHGNTWSRFDDIGDDAYRALDCFLQFDKVFFNNTYRCDYSGDVAFAVAMSRGVNIEGWCHDGQDNDGNVLSDCGDQYCGGITYSCANHTPVDDPFGGTCSNGICWETKTVGGHSTTYYYTRYVQNGGTLKFRFDGGSYSTGQPIAFALTDLDDGFVSYGKYPAPGSHNLTSDQIAQSGGQNVTYKAEDASGYTGDIDMVMYVNLTSGWSSGEHNITVSITQYGSNLIIYDVPIIVSSSAPTNWNETEEMSGTISAPCSDPAVSGYVPDNDLDYYPNCADQDCDGFIGGTNCTSGNAYCEYGLELTCYDCFNNDAQDGYDCADADCDLKPGDYQDMTNLCEYQEGAGFSNATHESFYPWRTACADLFDNDQDASTPYSTGYTDYIDCCDPTVCWQKGGTSTSDPCPSNESNLAGWCFDGINNDYDDGSNSRSCSQTGGSDCRDYDCRGQTNGTDTCPTNERHNRYGQVNDSQCFDNIDNDLDNPSMTYTGPAANIDCADVDCLGVANPANPNEVCYPYEFNLAQHYQFCNNNYDDDGDNSQGWPNGGTDCTDPDCNRKFGSCGPCPGEENYTWSSCSDGLDNDHMMPTGITDCADINCSGEIGSTANGEACEYGTETSCFDGFDNDAQGGADCADVDCNGVGWCEYGTETSCTDGLDNDADGYYDCADSDCYGVGACPSQGWSTVGCTTIPYTTSPSAVGGTTVSVGHLQRHYVFTNYTVRVVGSGSYNSISIILGDATDPTRYFPYNASNCTMSGTNANKLRYVSTQDQVGRIDHDPGQVGAGNPLNGFDVTLNCGGVSSPQAKTYSISITNSLSDGSPDNGAGTRSPTVYENTPPTVSSVEVGPINSSNFVNIPYGGTIRYRAIPSSDPSGICRCAFDLDGTVVQSSDGNCLYATTYTDDDGSYQLSANATDGADNTGTNGGSRTIGINVMPVPTAASINMTEPFYRSTDGALIGASFRTADSGNFQSAACNAYIEDSSGSVVWSGTLTKTGGSGSTVECNGTVPAPNSDGMYRAYVNVTDEDGDQVSSYKKVFYVCDSLTSRGTGWTCAKADFDQDGWTEGVNTSLYGDPNMVCDMCPNQVNTGQDDDADGIDNICDTQASLLSIWDSGDPAGGGQTIRVGQSVGFYANYTSGGSALTSSSCNISFSDGQYQMSYSIPTALYTFSRSFSSHGTYGWNVTCHRGGYDSKSENDTLTVSGAAVGNLTISLTINNTSNMVYVPGAGAKPASQWGTVWNSPPSYYLASYGSGVLYGLVFAYQNPEFLRYDKTPSSHTMTVALGKDNPLAFLVFTKGDWRAIEEKMGLIKSQQFLEKPSPSFGYGLGLYSTVKSLLGYGNIDVQSDLILNPGTHKLILESNKTGSGYALTVRRG